jgi:hypothetical protein
MSDTPETDAAADWYLAAAYSTDPEDRTVPLSVSRKLERERDDYMERFRIAISERDSWRMRAEQKYAMRRELEELLGVDSNSASDEQFMKGLDSLKKIIRERDEARQALMKIEDLFIDGTDIYADREMMGIIARNALEGAK